VESGFSRDHGLHGGRRESEGARINVEWFFNGWRVSLRATAKEIGQGKRELKQFVTRVGCRFLR